MSKTLFVLGAVLIVLALVGCGCASCPASGCGSGGGNWDASAQAFLTSDVPLVGLSTADEVADEGTKSSFKAGAGVKNSTEGETDESANTPNADMPKVPADYVQPSYRSDLFLRGDLLKSLPSVSSSDVVLDVSNKYFPGQAHIKGSINIPTRSFLYENGTLRPVPEIAKVLGNAGISIDDPIIVSSDTFRSGEATFVLWLLSYLGDENVKALDGGLDDWTLASLPLETEQNSRQAVNFTPHLKPELLADYSYVQSGKPQTVDARTFVEYGKGRIPGAFSIEPESILENGKIKPGEQLNQSFARLDINKPVVVYSTDLFNASLVWYSLQLMGFNSSLYSWQDWQEHRQQEVYKIK